MRWGPGLILAAPVLPALVTPASADPGAQACTPCRDALVTLKPDTRVSLALDPSTPQPLGQRQHEVADLVANPPIVS